jgi:hypothetical protein
MTLVGSVAAFMYPYGSELPEYIPIYGELNLNFCHSVKN